MKETTNEIIRPKVELFPLGRMLATPGALEAMTEAYGERARMMLAELLHRHQCGDWGVVCASDAKANDRALVEGTRLLSAYLLPDDCRVWIITECDRSATTLLLPEEY
jgi:hypothetical protein